LAVVERTDELSAEVLGAGQWTQGMGAEERRRRRVRTHEARRARARLAVDDGVVDRDVVAPEAPRPRARRRIAEHAEVVPGRVAPPGAAGEHAGPALGLVEDVLQAHDRG